MANITLYVPKMSCTTCVAKIENAFSHAHKVTARVNLADKQVLIEGDMAAREAIAVVQGAGYASEQIFDAKSAAQDKIRLDQEEYRKRMIQAAVGLGLGVPLMLWGLLGGEMMVNNQNQQLGWGAVGIITFILLITTGLHFYQGMWSALKARSANMDTLIVLGTNSAWIYSMLVVVTPQWFPADTRHVYFEASVMILGLINLGHALELRARGKTSAAVQKLVGLQASTAIRISASGDEAVEIRHIQLGDSVRLRPGDRVALDGEVISGRSLLNESMLTGEPVPVAKGVGDSLSAGTVNGNASLIYRVTAGMQDTRLAKIIELVQQAQTSKMPIGRLTDKISAYFVPVVVIIAIVSALIWFVAGPAPQLSHALVVLTSVLIIACPCALGLATPMSIMVSVGRAAQMGVLVRNGEALQTASKVNCVVLDKTGTITLGQPELISISLLATDETYASVLLPVASLERHSEHPLASAVIAKAKTENLNLIEPKQFENHQGKGIVGLVEASEYAVGNLGLMQKQGITELREHEALLSQFTSKGQTPVYVAKDGRLVAILAIADPIKPGAAAAVKTLKADGMRVILLTGDNQQTALAVAGQVGIDEVVADVLPAQKQQQVIALKGSGQVVAMVGDGINDAPALMSADIGIAMGSGTEVAIESADFTLLSTRLMVIADALALARASMTNIKQNLFGAFVYNSLGIPLAAGALYPVLGLLLSPVVAGGAMALSSLTVVSNANRLRSLKLRP